METNQWHAWRAEGIGASDAPIIMSVSPWNTPYGLWEQKTKRVTKDFSNWATDRGNRLEPKARALYEFQTGLSLPATLVVNEQFPFVRASLDGYDAEKGIILELKCPGKEDHDKAVVGKVPEKYWPQVQHQLLACPQAKEVHYVSYDGETLATVIIVRDEAYQKELFEKLCAFWKCVKEDQPPELTDKDFKKVRSEELEVKITELLKLKNQIKVLGALQQQIEDSIYEDEKVVGRRVLVGKWKINLCYRKGNVDYNKVDELKGVDLEKYRKKPSSYRMITEVKE